MEEVAEMVRRAKDVVVFSGSGLSATSGMSTFSTKGGLYERARQKYGLQDGKILFTYSFYNKRKIEAESFFVQIHKEALKAKPALGHRALGLLWKTGRLVRHYTLNIDGLASQVDGMSIWDPETNESGVTVEMHGSIHHLVCTECGESKLMSSSDAEALSNSTSVPCDNPECLDKDGEKPMMRFKVMMYDDGDGEYITPDDVMDLMEEDIKRADVILWVGISFQQSASTSYFRKVRHWLQEDDRQMEVPQIVINPSDDAVWNLTTACSNQHELNIIEVLGTADDVLPKFV